MRNHFKKIFSLKKSVGVTTHHSVGLLTCLRPCHHIVIININRNKINVDILVLHTIVDVDSSTASPNSSRQGSRF